MRKLFGASAIGSLSIASRFGQGEGFTRTFGTTDDSAGGWNGGRSDQGNVTLDGVGVSNRVPVTINHRRGHVTESRGLI